MNPYEKKTIVLGASPNPDRASYMAMILLRERNIPFIAVGRRDYDWNGIRIEGTIPSGIENVHTVSLYLNARNQKDYYSFIFSLSPERVIFNPGTENPDLSLLLTGKGIKVVEGCMLVMLKTGNF